MAGSFHSLPDCTLFMFGQYINKTLIYARVYDETVRDQFASAMAHIEGIAIADWPIQTTTSTEPIPISVDQICDSV